MDILVDPKPSNHQHKISSLNVRGKEKENVKKKEKKRSCKDFILSRNDRHTLPPKSREKLSPTDAGFRIRAHGSDFCPTSVAALYTPARVCTHKACKRRACKHGEEGKTRADLPQHVHAEHDPTTESAVYGTRAALQLGKHEVQPPTSHRKTLPWSHRADASAGLPATGAVGRRGQIEALPASAPQDAQSPQALRCARRRAERSQPPQTQRTPPPGSHPLSPTSHPPRVLQSPGSRGPRAPPTPASAPPAGPNRGLGRRRLDEGCRETRPFLPLLADSSHSEERS